MHKVLLGVEKNLTYPGPSATPIQTSAYPTALEAHQDKNGMIFTRLMLATSEARSYQSAASQTVQACAPIGSSYNRDGRGAFLALNANTRPRGFTVPRSFTSSSYPWQLLQATTLIRPTSSKVCAGSARSLPCIKTR